MPSWQRLQLRERDSTTEMSQDRRNTKAAVHHKGNDLEKYRSAADNHKIKEREGKKRDE